MADLTKSKITEKLLLAQVSEADVNALIQALDQCEMARFAPVGNTTQEKLFQEVSDTIATINQQLK